MLRRTKNSGYGSSIMVRLIDPSSTQTHTTSATGVTITPGSILIVCIAFRYATGASITSFTDNYNNVWTPAINTPYLNGGPDENGYVYYAQNVKTGAAGTHTFTMVTSGFCQASLMVMEVAGAPAAAAIEAQSYTLWDTAGTSHTGPSVTTANGGFAILCIIDNMADASPTAPVYTLPSGWSGGGTAEQGGSASPGWGCNIFSKPITSGGTVAPSWTTSVSIRNASWLLMIRPAVPRTVNESYSYDFSRQPNTTSFSNSRFKAYSTNGIRIDSGVASSNNGGELRIMDLDYVYNNSGTISSKVTVKGTRGYDVADDEAGPVIVLNSGPNMWKGYGARSLNTYQRLLRLDDPTTAWSAGGQLGLGSTTTYPYANNDIVELRYTPANGSLQLLLNGTVLQSATDTTYSTANLSPGFWVNPYNHGGTGITDYTPSLTNPAIELVGTTAANTAGASYTTTFLFQNANDLAYDPAGYVADRTGVVTQATFGIYDWNGSNFLKLIPYDENLNRIGTSVATFSYTQGTGFITAAFDTPFNVIKGKKYLMAMATNSYIKAYGRGDTLTYSKIASGYTTIPSSLTSNTSSVGSIDRPIMFYSGNPIPSAMKQYANSALKVTNIVETPALTTTYDFNETDGTKLTTINPAFYGQYISGLQTLTGNLVATSFGGSIKAVYGKGFKANQSSQVTKTNSLNTGYWVSVHAITDQTSDGYVLAVRTGTTGAELYRAGSVVAGPYTIASAPASSTTTIKLESVAQANGSLIINSYRNGSLIGSYTDTTPLPVGKPAFWVSTTTAASDDPVSQFVVDGEAPKSQLYANGTFVVGEYIEN